MSKLFVFGMGYAAGHLAALMEERGWSVTGTTRDGRGGTVRFDDRERVEAAMAAATHILSSVPPEGEQDPVLVAYGPPLAGSKAWVGYLSSTGVYGDTGGAWVDVCQSGTP